MTQERHQAAGSEQSSHIQLFLHCPLFLLIESTNKSKLKLAVFTLPPPPPPKKKCRLSLDKDCWQPLNERLAGLIWSQWGEDKKVITKKGGGNCWADVEISWLDLLLGALRTWVGFRGVALLWTRKFAARPSQFCRFKDSLFKILLPFVSQSLNYKIQIQRRTIHPQKAVSGCPEDGPIKFHLLVSTPILTCFKPKWWPCSEISMELLKSSALILFKLSEQQGIIKQGIITKYIT